MSGDAAQKTKKLAAKKVPAGLECFGFIRNPGRRIVHTQPFCSIQ
jgi:hypothetical protein